MSVPYTISLIASIVHGKLVQQGSDDEIYHLLTDSRKLVFAPTSLFIALAGPRRNGDKFVRDLYDRGVLNFIVSDAIEASDFPKANFIYVPDTLHALQELAAHHRRQFSIPVIGITGSNGKTIVKEWLNQMLEDEYVIARSPKSYNSQIGVPLSVWQMGSQHTLGLLEAGISQPGEMETLRKMIQPTIGVFTNIGDAHSENFSSREEKAQEKARLFQTVDVVIANGDPVVTTALTQFGIRFISVSSRYTGSDIVATLIEKDNRRTVLRIQCNPAQSRMHFEDFDASIPFTDEASVENALTCCAVLLSLSYSPATICERLNRLRTVSMRLELKKGINGCSIVNDSYVSDIHSLKIALDFLQQQPQEKKTVILSDISETGIAAAVLYQQIAELLQHKRITKLIAIGTKLASYQHLFNDSITEKSFFPTTEDFLKNFHSSLFRNEAILIKGARRFAFERIFGKLDAKAHQTVMEINLTSVLHNLRQYQQLLQPNTQLMVMVKAFSYGSGSFEIANLLQFHKVDYLAVAYVDEGVELREAGITLPIMVMNPEESSFPAMVEYHIEPEIFSFPILEAFDDYLKQEGIIEYPVHLKVDTGMHRLGFELTEIPELAARLQSNPRLKVQSVFSHLAASEDAAMDDFTAQQMNEYRQASEMLSHALPYRFIRHISNSAAIARHPDMQMDMVRLGIGLYGINTTEDIQLDLREAITLKTTIAQIKTLNAGQTVGYGRKGKITGHTRIATIRIGYADGYTRSMGNGNACVMIRGHQLPTIGNIAMDMTMVNLGDIEEITEKDEVIIFGPGLSVSTVAQWADTIPYEILTGISQRVQRIYFEE